jgi:hypothetical protein
MTSRLLVRLQFTVLEVQNVLLELDSNKGLGPDGVPPLIMKNCASTFALQRVSSPINGKSRLLIMNEFVTHKWWAQ